MQKKIKMFNSSIIYQRKNCRACESNNLELFFALKPSPIGDAFVNKNEINIIQEKFPINLYMCKDCMLFQLIDVISPDILYGNYIYVSESSVGLKNHFKNFANHVLDSCEIKEDSLIVDIGSNDGILLNFFKSSGMRVVGVEPASAIAKIANDNGIETVADYLSQNAVSDIINKHGKAKIITSNNVFANVDDIRSWVSCVKSLLDDDGIYIFESYYLLDVVNNFVFDFIYHEHLSAFSVKPINNLFKLFGMELIRVEAVNTKGGSLRYYVQKKPGTLIDNGSVQKYLDLEDSKNLYSKATFDDYSKRINSLKIKSHEFLRNAKQQNKIIAGFGASITGTTLIHHFELEEYIDYLIDDNKAKQGMYSPGIHLPVYPVEEINKLNPDIVYVLAWRFISHFLEKKSSVKWSGQVINPIPEFKVL